uniref:Protein NLP1 n=1 Tax=Anthurium amnicola TaxID=1678845 RepID=A0A1D1XIV9_9ARAE
MEDTVPLYDGMLDTLSDASVDLDLMGELLSEDVWPGTPDLADLLQRSSSTSPPLFGSSYLNSPFKTEKGSFNPTHEQDALHGEVKTSGSSKSATPNPCTRGFDQYSAQASESGMAGTSRSWSIESRANRGPISSLKQRLTQAVTYIKEAHGDGEVLVQVWVPTRKGDRDVLTTYGQPFSLDPNCQRLMNYRNVSTSYQFSAEENSVEPLGLPGRVFLGKLPEWSPDVRFFSRHEYPRVNYAQWYDVRGTVALPIFERHGRICLGVVEVLMTTEKINYRSDVDHICNALQAVDLSSTEVQSVPHVKMKSDSYLAALPEISAVMRAVCQSHGLPLAQTWMSCIQQGKSGSRHSDANYNDCASTVDAACFVSNPFLSSFHEACSEHHLLRGQGVVGKAFMTNQPCFSSDITAMTKTEYPLSHHARIFRLRAAVAIRMRSVYTGKADFVLEFFLPVDCLKSEEQKVILNSLSATMQQVCQSLRVVTSNELEDETVLQVNEQLPSDGFCGKHLDGEDGNPKWSSVVLAPTIEVSGPKPSWVASTMEGQLKEKNAMLPVCASLEFEEQELHGFSVKNNQGASDIDFTDGKSASECNQGSVKDNIEHGDSFAGEPCFPSRSKATEKKRTKMEKTINLQVLQQYFSGSLKDAAKNIGVCPTTLKRICRQHGITRWPSRKIKKVGHSLRKLQVVIDSIQGGDSAFQLSSLYASFPKASGSDLKAQKEKGRSLICTSKHDDIPESSNAQHSLFTSPVSTSNSLSSHCSQSSSSSHSCSSGTKQCGSATENSIKEEASVVENQSGMLKRAHSELELHHLVQGTPPTLSRSQSLKSLGDNHGFGSLSPSQHRCINGPLRVKAVYGNEKIRFKLQPTWGFQEVKQEIAKRFNIGNISAMDLKYLDDEFDWVLLTCDADLQECTDIYRSSSVHTIKISVQVA